LGPSENPTGAGSKPVVADVDSAASLPPPLAMLPHQALVFHHRAPNIVYVKGRRAGGTMGAVLRLIQLARDNAGSKHLWIDTVQRNIDRVVRRYFQPRLARREAEWLVTKQTLSFENGSLVDFGSMQQPENIEGFGYDTLWINEAGIVLKNEDLYHNTLRPMLLDAGSAQSYFFGTPKGRGLFQRMYYWGQDASYPAWKSFRDPSAVNPVLSTAMLEQLRREMPERVYRQEILAEFVDDATQVFRNLERAAVAKEEREPAPGAHYVMGLDLARYRDYTAVWVGRMDMQAAVFCDRFHGISWQQQVQRLRTLSRKFNNAFAHVDATGVGDAVCEQLREADVLVVPEKFTNASKQQMIERLAGAIEQESFTFVPHETTLRELETFEYQPTPTGGTRLSAPPGQHDDCVIALALCHAAMMRPRGELLLGPELTSYAGFDE
jgi:phage terminase large subunit-like protein